MTQTIPARKRWATRSPRFAEPLSALPAALEQLLADQPMKQRLEAFSKNMQATRGTDIAARAIMVLPNTEANAALYERSLLAKAIFSE